MEVIMNKLTKTKLALLLLVGLGTTAPIAAMDKVKEVADKVQSVANNVAKNVAQQVAKNKADKNKNKKKDNNKMPLSKLLFYGAAAKVALLDFGLGNVAIDAAKYLVKNPFSFTGQAMTWGFYGVLAYNAYQEGWFSKARDFVLGDDSSDDENSDSDKSDDSDDENSDEDESDEETE